jgi:hypothetical protein
MHPCREMMYDITTTVLKIYCDVSVSNRRYNHRTHPRAICTNGYRIKRPLIDGKLESRHAFEDHLEAQNQHPVPVRMTPTVGFRQQCFQRFGIVR